MHSRKRVSLILVAGALLVGGLGTAMYVRWKAPPEIARLLPEADAVVYFNVKPVRAATHFDQNAPKPTPEYKAFIDATGIVPERDLDEGAVAVNRMANPYGPNGVTGFSEVFRGRFDEARLKLYLGEQAKVQETYAGHVVYSIVSTQGYVDRVTVLDEQRIAASNMPTTEQIHAIIDHAGGDHVGGGGFAGPSLIKAHYADVPRFSSAWAIGQLGLPFAEDGRITVAGLQLPMPADGVFVASLRYEGGIRVRVDELTGSELEAARTAQGLMNLIALLRGLGKQQGGSVATGQMLDTVGVEAKKDRATLTAVIPAELLQTFARPSP